MPPRVLPADVKLIFTTDMADESMEVFISNASLVVNSTLGNSGLSEESLKEIERWLSAHFACVLERRVKDVSLGTGKVSYTGKFGMGLDATDYGQQVKVLDTTGRLADLGAPSASIDILEFYTSAETGA